MKKFLFLACVITLFTTTGCFDGHDRDHWHHDRGEFNTRPATVAARAPEVILASSVVELPAPEFSAR